MFMGGGDIMIRKLFNFNVKTKIFMIFLLIFGFASIWIVRTSINQVEAENQQFIRELLQVNAHMSIAIVDTVRMYTMMTLELTADLARNAIVTDGILDDELTSIFNNMNVEYDGTYLIDNIEVFDTDFVLLSAADPHADLMDLSEFILPGDDKSAVRLFPTFVNPINDRVQVLFTHPVIHEGEVIATVALRGNSEVLRVFLLDFLRIYDNFVNIADSYGTIFFTTRPEAYSGIHVDELGLYEVFGEVPMNTVFRHQSAVTKVYKLAYILEFGDLNWMVVSFFDEHSIENNAFAVIGSVFPVLLAMLAAGAVTFFLMTRSLYPLKELAEGASEVSKGNVSVSFLIDSDDEFGQVSRSFQEIIVALNVLGENFKNAERALMKGDSAYSLTDTKLGGIFDDMISSANNIIRHIQLAMVEAQQASKAKSDFLAAMSHEIRTPLNAILGITQIELQKAVEENDTTQALRKINLSGRTLLGIINDILDMSKIEMGKLEFAESDYDLENLISETVQANTVRIGAKQIEFILEVDKNLPKRLVGDELRIKQILNNLLSNAIKYTSAGHVKFSISGTTKFSVSADNMEANTLLRFVVEDTGQGLKPDDLSNLFDPYSRFNLEENRSVEGSGLGLTITQRLVEMMEGWIYVESEYGKGSVFTIHILQKTGTMNVIGQEGAERLCNFEFPNSDEKYLVNYEPMPYGSVLVVDDVETNLHVAEGLLAPYHVRVETATSGFEVLEKIEKGAKYDIILMDHMMPEMDGIETTNRLKQMGYDGTIIALTANALIGNAEMFRSKGFDWFISKPVDIRQLDSALLRFIKDKHPDKHAGQESRLLYQSTKPQNIQPKLRNAVLRDANRAIKAIGESLESGDVTLFITSVHAMKSAMANVKEIELSEMASTLEKAGHDEDYDFIYEKTPKFVKRLEEFIERL